MIPKTVRPSARGSRDAQQPGRCARCGDSFECGARADREHCWCEGFPALPAPAPGSGCYCPRCLKESIEADQSRQARRIGP
ncbi:MAG TPA: cysteine-rich CWC family protein [Burkholderiales bacterium]|nr:cysteine-rich CWC family protein [Burkholderiales bacterium]